MGEATRATYYDVLSFILVPSEDVGHGIVVEEIVTGISKQQPITRSRMSTFIHRVVDSAVGLRYGVGEAVGIAGYDACGAIRTAPVNHDVLKIGVGLTQHVLHRPFYKGGAVVCHGDD